MDSSWIHFRIGNRRNDSSVTVELYSLPLIVELGVSLHQVEDTTQEALAFCQLLHECMGTCSLQS